jgi:hypothetical protein
MPLAKAGIGHALRRWNRIAGLFSPGDDAGPPLGPAGLALLATAFVTGGGSHLVKRFRRCKSGKDPVPDRSI